ncbi:MAG: TetR/AcrR family transcriptional regulator [Eubacteriales bacterium]|nr:TetR/AcrR family transcriptional regulator [Clostridiales bacterium]MDY5836737.1 TetR/AcrR family transcriptional regulator [Eubacteriales bacterium]
MKVHKKSHDVVAKTQDIEGSLSNKTRVRKPSRNEMVRTFVNACVDVIREKGPSQTGIREVASRAGYKPATVYNYFENFDHLMLYASMQFLARYAHSLDQYLVGSKNALDKFLSIWDCFCYFAYNDPEIYQYRFYLFNDNSGNRLVQQYYQEFPEELQQDWSPAIRDMMTKTDIEDRNMVLVEDLAREGYIDPNDCKMLNNLTTILFEGFFSRVLRKKMSADMAHQLTLTYFAIVMNCHLKKKADSEIFLAWLTKEKACGAHSKTL